MTSFVDRQTALNIAIADPKEPAGPLPEIACAFCGSKADMRPSALATLGWHESLCKLRFCSLTCVASYNAVAPRYGHPAVETKVVVNPAVLPAKVATPREVVSTVRCVRCRHSAELVGQLDADGVLRPNPVDTASALGWARGAHGWTCSRNCAALLDLEASNAMPPVPAVQRLADGATAARVAREVAPLAQRRLASHDKARGT